MYERCAATRPDGTPCSNFAMASGFCPACDQERSGRDGRYGLSKEYHDPYESFRKSHNEFSARDEIALLKTLLLRLVESVEKRSEKLFVSFVQDAYEKIKLDLTVNFNMGDPLADEWSRRIMVHVRSSFTAHIGEIADINLKEIRAAGDLVMKIVKCLDIIRKMEEGVTITMEVDESAIRHLLQNYIYPAIPPELRRVVAANMANYSRGRVKGVNLDVEPDYDIIDAEFDACPAPSPHPSPTGTTGGMTSMISTFTAAGTGT